MAWGMRALVGLLAGLLVAGLYGLFLMMAAPRRDSGGFVLSGALLFSLGMAVLMIQAAHLLTPLGVVHRAIRVGVLVAVAVLGLIWVVVAAWRSRGQSQHAALRVEG